MIDSFSSHSRIGEFKGWALLDITEDTYISEEAANAARGAGPIMDKPSRRKVILADVSPAKLLGDLIVDVTFDRAPTRLRTTVMDKIWGDNGFGAKTDVHVTDVY